ncbi:MAG: hypothetical protein AAF321_07150 [Pseudomonadota bacterium]
MTLSDGPSRPGSFLLAPLVWLGRQGAWPMAVSLAGGFALPMLAEPLRPLLAPIVVALLGIALARVSPQALRASAGRPVILVGGTLWCLVALPLIAALAVRMTGLAETSPDLAFIIVAGLGSAPVVSAPAYAFMLGLPAATALALVAAGMMVVPVTMPLVLGLAFGGRAELTVDPVSLFWRLALLLALALAFAALLRRMAGPARITRSSDLLDGISHVLVFVLAIILVGSLTGDLIAAPGPTLRLAGLSCLVALAAFALTAGAARLVPGVDAEDRAVLGLCSSVRNLALVLAAVPDLGPVAIAYVGAVQVPIYLAPLALGLLRRRA